MRTRASCSADMAGAFDGTGRGRNRDAPAVSRMGAVLSAVPETTGAERVGQPASRSGDARSKSSPANPGERRGAKTLACP